MNHNFSNHFGIAVHFCQKEMVLSITAFQYDVTFPIWDNSCAHVQTLRVYMAKWSDFSSIFPGLELLTIPVMLAVAIISVRTFPLICT